MIGAAAISVGVVKRVGKPGRDNHAISAGEITIGKATGSNHGTKAGDNICAAPMTAAPVRTIQ